MVYMYHSFLVHSSAGGHLGCFHVLAMTNSAAMDVHAFNSSISKYKKQNLTGLKELKATPIIIFGGFNTLSSKYNWQTTNY